MECVRSASLCGVSARTQSGATAIEYALIAAGIGATIASTVCDLGSDAQGQLWWDKIGNAMF